MDPERRRKGSIKSIKDVVKDMNSGNLLTNIRQVGTNSTIMGILNMFIQLILTRGLGPAKYGEVQTLLTINSMILIGVAAVSFILARFISYYKSREQYDKMKFLANWAFTFFLMMGITVFIIQIIFAKITAGFLNITDYTIIIFFGLLTGVSFLTPIIEGIFKGLQEFKFYGRYKIAEALSRLILVAIAVLLGLKSKSILLAFVLGSVITILFSEHILKKVYISKPIKTSTKEFYKFAIPALLACFSLAVLSNIDLILVRHFFDPVIVGHYAAAGLLAKLAFGMAFGSATVMFPKVVEEFSNGDEREARKTLKNTLKITLSSSIPLAILLSILPNFISKTFFGPQYDVGSMIILYTWSLLFLSVFTIFAIYDLALKRYSFITIMIIAAILEIIQIIKVQDSIVGILWTTLIVNFTLMCIIIIKNHRNLITR